MTAPAQLPLAAEWIPPPEAGWETLDERRRGTAFLALTVRSVLNPPSATGMGFWSLNPYVGCEFGCAYCYARDTHRYAVERATETMTGGPASLDELARLPAALAFERRILVKTDAPAVLARTLDPARLAGEALVIGTATDPYQPAERTFRVTRRILEVLLRYRGLTIGLITKSPLVARDLDLLQQLGARHDVTVNISLATLDPRLARRLERRSPVPRARLRALAALTEGGVQAGLLVAPILPGITDDWAGLDALLHAARDAGARYAVGFPLRLDPVARRRFLPHLAEEFPELVARYRRHYGDGAYASREYRRALSRRLRALQRVYGFPVPASAPGRQRLEGRRPRAEAPVQATLWDA